jgi:hypothetical protein
MHWKMSVDLSRPAVASMGNLDPYDKQVTYSLLRSLAERSGECRTCSSAACGCRFLGSKIDELDWGSYT